MRTRYFELNGHWVSEQEYFAVKYPSAPLIMPDIDPYQSMITGEMITSRSRHREHLRQHGCEEVGNETKALFHQYDNLKVADDNRRKELIVAQINAMTHDEFKRALKRDIDRVKWNSRS